jgi:hypothetical protein
MALSAATRPNAASVTVFILCPGEGEGHAREEVISMWWVYIVVPIMMALGIYGFLTLVGSRTRSLSSKTDRRAEDMYDQFGDAPGRRHRQPQAKT